MVAAWRVGDRESLALPRLRASDRVRPHVRRDGARSQSERRVSRGDVPATRSSPSPAPPVNTWEQWVVIIGLVLIAYIVLTAMRGDR
jgi:hypothetical protein